MKKILSYFFTFICVVLICTLSITIAAAIPQRYIAENSKKSAEYYSSKLFEEKMNGRNDNTIIDNYADAILLNIVYCLDEKEPLKSSVCARYYLNDDLNVLKSYGEITENNELSPNEDYSRYWHGTMCFLKPLLILTDINGIHIINIIMLIMLTAVLAVILIKKNEKILCFSLILAMLITGAYIVPFCIEYISSFIIMLLISIILLLISHKNEKNIGLIFLISGMLICFFDFLTCETLTFTVPVSIILILFFKDKKLINFKDMLIFTIKNGVLWSAGYLGMFFTKWCLSYLFIGKKAFNEAFYNASRRIINSSANLQRGINGNRLFKNFVSLNIFDNTTTYGEIILRLGFIAFIVFCVIYLYKKKNAYEKELFNIFFIIMAIPYVRYLALNNHSEVHYYFTYRAQLPVIMLGIYMIFYAVDFKKISKEVKKIRRIFK